MWYYCIIWDLILSMRDSKGIFVALVSHDGVFCECFIDSASSWEMFGQKLVLNTKDPKSPTDPHWSWLLGTAIVKQASFFFQDMQLGVGQYRGCGAGWWPSALGSWQMLELFCVRSAFPGTGVKHVWKWRGEGPTLKIQHLIMSDSLTA